MAHPMLLLVWLAVGLALAQGQTYQAFKRKHINYPRTPVTPYCNRMMQRRGMTTPVCKVLNTFIIANDTNVKKVCNSEGIPVPDTNLWTSTQTFTLVNCRLRGAAHRPPPSHNKIRIACKQGLPVHFEKIIP
nr:ribonuclease-like [Pelodiscus sinensis]|eukprot:XP_014435816.1 ribonuclease-like [Pelodiscus sinensis]